jgi:hypothetical protein
VLAVVCDGFPHGIDAACQRRLCNNPSSPDCLDQLVLAYHPVTVRKQKRKQIKHLRLDGNELGTSSEFPPFKVDNVDAER